MIFNKSRSGFENEPANQSAGRRTYVKSKTVQLKENDNEPVPLRAHGKTYTMGGVKMPPTGLYYTTNKSLKQVREPNRISAENIKHQNTLRQHNDSKNKKITLDAESSMNKVGKTQTTHVHNPPVQNIKMITPREQQNNAENSNRYRETQKQRQEYVEKNVKRPTDWPAWQEEVEKEKNAKENDASDDNEEKQEEEEEEEEEKEEEEEEEEEEDEEQEEEEEEDDEEEDDEEEENEEEEDDEDKDDEDEDEEEKYGRLLHIPRSYKQSKMPDTYSKNKNLLLATTKKTHQDANVGNKVKNSTEHNRNNQTKDFNNLMQRKQSKSVSIQIDTENWINSTVQFSSASSNSIYKNTKPNENIKSHEKKTNEKTKSNEKTIKQIIRSKLRKVRIILKFLYICRKNICDILNTGRPPTSANKTKNAYNKVIRVQGPFLLKKESEKQTTVRKPGYIPKHLKKFLKISSEQNKSINKNKRIVVKKEINTNVYQLFQNMLAIDTLGRLQRWDGYNWNQLHVPFYHFTSVYTNSKGHVLCVDQNNNPGYLMGNKYFKKVETWQGNYLAQIVIDQNNKIWGLHLSGDLIKWNKYNWMKIKKAYGISKIKFIAIDRKNHLWLLDSNNYLFSYDTIKKRWTQENVNGNNIKYFDFDENNYLIAVTEDGLIKIHKRKKWIQYGMLGQLKICGVHFIREMHSASSIVKTKNEKKINTHKNNVQG